MNYLAGAKRDFLTQCFTRESLEFLMSKMLVEYNAHNRPFSFFLMDVDHFKTYNDRMGHLHGDEVLKYFAGSIRLYLEDIENYPFRLGGDEFLVVFPRTTPQEANGLAQRLEKALRRRPFITKGREMRVSFSGGIASYPSDGTTLEELLERADKAMYYSKKRGRGRITLFNKIIFMQIRRIISLGLLIALSVLLVLVTRDIATHRLSNMKDYTARHIRETSNQVRSWVTKRLSAIPEASVPLPAVSVSPAPVASSPAGESRPDNTLAPAVAAQNPSASFVTVHLVSGGVSRGFLMDETDDEIRLVFELAEGSGSTRIKKSQIGRIER